MNQGLKHATLYVALYFVSHKQAKLNAVPAT